MPETLREDTQPLEPVYPKPLRQQDTPQRGGCGCWIPAILSLLVAVVLVVVGLFVPPISLYDRLFGVQYAMLDSAANAVATDGLTIVVDPNDTGDEFGVSLGSFTLASLNTSSPDAAAASSALAAAPPTLALQSPLYTIKTKGIQPGQVTFSVAMPANVTADVVDLYAWNAERGEWTFVPSQIDTAGSLTTTLNEVPDQLALFQAAPQDQPTVLVAVDVTQELTADVASLATIVSPAGLQPTLTGTLTGSLAPGFDMNAGYNVMPVLRNFTDERAIDPETVTAIIGNNALRASHIEQITSFASGGFDGVVIDYRDLPPNQRGNFSLFIRELGASLDSIGLGLAVVVPAAENIGGVWETGAYDWRALGTSVDLVQVNFGLDPAAFAAGPDRLVEAMLRWGVGEVSRQKLLLGLSSQSVQQIEGRFAPISYAEALAGVGDVEIDATLTEADTLEPGTEFRASLNGFQAVSGMDATSQTPYIDYTDENGAVISRMWLATADALRFRMDRTQNFALRGVAFDDLLNNTVANDVLQSVVNYKLGVPAAPTARELALRWIIQGSDGVVNEVTTGLNEELVVTIQAPDGNYAVNVEVVGGEESVARSGAAVSVFAPTPTPTPIPTATPTPTPVPTRVVQAPPVNNNGGGGSNVSSGPVVPAVQGMTGNFEYGGHVTNANTGAAGLMASAGMNWMKVQIPYRLGMGPGDAAGQIAAAHGSGFKILLGIVGSPGEVTSIGWDAYLPQYTQFLAGVAALGPDAIEVWNEPNLDREWPRDQISGELYVRMLRDSYNAIKGTNGSVMVISGAPAPTGAEAAFPGQVKNDDNWLREVVNAGGLNYMDCVGAHYNEGIISPTQRGGDPRDGYYTRYFHGMLDTYGSIVGGKPICFTELGFLTSEGYPPLPEYFAWAQNVSLSQQAAWLAEAAVLSSQRGVRLMIIWNIDFSRYDSDPMAGFAIIRPGGGCPACSALAGAR